MKQDMKTLGFDLIIEQLKTNAVSTAAAEILSETAPILNESLCLNRVAETTEARKVLEISGNPPLAIMNGLDEAVTKAAQGDMLMPEQLTETARFMGTVRRLKRYLQNAEAGSPMIASWQTELPELDETADAIERAIREDEILDEASAALHDIRRRKESKEQAIREKMNQGYAWYANFTTMFPLFGMLGTVYSLIRVVGDSLTETSAFFSALTSTAWGIVAAIIFKALDSTLSYKIEDNEKHTEHLLFMKE